MTVTIYVPLEDSLATLSATGWHRAQPGSSVTNHRPLRVRSRLPAADAVTTWWILVAVVTLLALALRLVGLDRKSVWFDEALGVEAVLLHRRGVAL
jgi:hypothetical protein